MEEGTLVLIVVVFLIGFVLGFRTDQYITENKITKMQIEISKNHTESMKAYASSIDRKHD